MTSLWFRRVFNHGWRTEGVTEPASRRPSRPTLSFPAWLSDPSASWEIPFCTPPTEPVPVADDGSLPAEIADLITDLYDTMDAANGVGLAANQIGVAKRVFVYDCADARGKTARRRGVVVNPVLETSEIPETMPDPEDDDEGCLSVPGESFPTGRASWARVTGLDADGAPITVEGNGSVRADAAARDRAIWTGSCTWTG